MFKTKFSSSDNGFGVGFNETTIIKGEDGFSPIIEVVEVTSGHMVTITDKEDTNTFIVKNGKDGAQGIKGDKGEKGKDGYTPIKGVDYFDGKDGRTPVKGVDYFTDADKQEIAEQAAELVDVSGGGAAIIDVPELPTENINKQAFYRLQTASFVENGEIYGWKCHIVDSLPEIGEPVSTDMQNITAYYNKQDDSVYGYADSMISQVGGVPVGWYPMDILAQAFNVSWGGVITDVSDDDGNNIYLLLSYDFYMYQDERCKVPFAYEKAPRVNIAWDGNMEGKITLDMSLLGYENTYFVKVSDDVFTTDEVIGWEYQGKAYDGGSHSREIDYDSLDIETYPGAFTINNEIVILHDADTLAAALGIPTGIYTNGTYFLLNTEQGYISSLTSLPRITKISQKYIDTDGLATEAYVHYLISGAIGGVY